MNTQFGQQTCFSAFSAGKRKNRKSRALVRMRVSYPNLDDLTEYCFKEIWEGASI
jgi:hypothetical protein